MVLQVIYHQNISNLACNENFGRNTVDLYADFHKFSEAMAYLSSCYIVTMTMMMKGMERESENVTDNGHWNLKQQIQWRDSRIHWEPQEASFAQPIWQQFYRSDPIFLEEPRTSWVIGPLSQQALRRDTSATNKDRYLGFFNVSHNHLTTRETI